MPIAQYTAKIQVWKVRVGRVSLYLLDTNHPDNVPEIAISPTGSTAVTSARASARRSCWVSAASNCLRR